MPGDADWAAANGALDNERKNRIAGYFMVRTPKNEASRMRAREVIW